MIPDIYIYIKRLGLTVFSRCVPNSGGKKMSKTPVHYAFHCR